MLATTVVVDVVTKSVVDATVAPVAPVAVNSLMPSRTTGVGLAGPDPSGVVLVVIRGASAWSSRV